MENAVVKFICDKFKPIFFSIFNLEDDDARVSIILDNRISLLRDELFAAF